MEFLSEGFWWGVFWLAVGWNVPQPAWAKWVQAKLVAGYYWAKAKYDAR